MTGCRLPDKPSRGFLRQEAKDLLAALREASPGASLADAQQALATEYGLRDWNALKSEAERRAASLPAAPGLAAELADVFGLGLITAAATPVAFTPMGRSWSLTTDRGRWLAVTVYPWIDEAQAGLGARLRDAAVAAGLVAPTPVRSPAGRLLERARAAGKPWTGQLARTLPVLYDLRTIETSFAVAITGYLNWAYNTICEAISPADPEHATFADLETVDLLKQPMSREVLEKLLTAIDA